MLDALTVSTQLLGLMVALVILGEPLRLLLSKIFGLLRSLDLVEMSVLDTYFGGLILYILALPPLHLLNSRVLFSLVLLFALVSIVYHLAMKRTFQRFAGLKLSRLLGLKDQVLVFGLFGVALLIQTVSLAPFIYGSIHDASFHSITTQVIIENGYIPSNLECIHFQL